MKASLQFLAIIALIAFSSCSAQRQLSNRIEGEWAIERYHVLQTNGSESTLENVGTIIFNSNGRGTQTFTSAISQIDSDNTGEFRWDNTVDAVFITGQNASNRKAWLIIESSRNSQKWGSTDSEGTVQIMQLRKKD